MMEAMVDAEIGAQIAAARRRIAPALPKHVDAKSVELAAFSAVGRTELGHRVWADARQAGEAARRSWRELLRTRFGPRNPHGWVMFVAFGGALCAAVAAALASGLRTDPADVAAATTVLGALAGGASIMVLIAPGGRPLNRSMIRIHAILTVALVIAAGFMLGRGLDAGSITVGVSALSSGVGFIAVLWARARDRQAADEIDAALDIALADIGPRVRAESLRLQAEVAAEAGPQDALRIVEIRTAVLAELAAEGIRLEPVDPSAPAGSVIIDDMIRSRLPDARRREV